LQLICEELSVKQNICSFLRALNIDYYGFPLEDLSIDEGDVTEIDLQKLEDAGRVID
jgi:hypothetical protein